MSGHTPGSWRVNPDNDGSGFIVERANGKTIAIVYSDHEPDARLIAAAPELYEALRLIANEAGTTDRDIMWVRTHARAALAKVQP